MQPEPTKNFDINGPAPADADPMVVGHQPMMQSPASTPLPEPGTGQPAAGHISHTPRVIKVTSEVKASLAAVAPADHAESVSPVVAAGEQPAATDPPKPDLPAAEPDLSHIPHVPLSSPHSGTSGKLSHYFIWIIIGVAMGLAALYLVKVFA